MTRVRSCGSLAAAQLSLAHCGALNIPRTPVARRLGAAPACFQCGQQSRRFNHVGSPRIVVSRARGIRQIRPAVFVAGQRRSLSSNPGRTLFLCNQKTYTDSHLQTQTQKTTVHWQNMTTEYRQDGYETTITRGALSKVCNISMMS